MPKIQSIDACAAAIPLDNVTSFSTRNVSTRYYGWVNVRSPDGVEGIGFCYVGSAVFCDLFVNAVEQLLAPILIGQDSHAVERLWLNIYQEFLL